MKRTAYPLFSILALAALLAASGCKPTSTGQTRANMQTRESVTDLKMRYPQFAPLLAQLENESNIEWDKAQQMANEQERILQMQRANRIITSNSLYQELRRYETNVQSVIRKRDELDRLAVIPEQRTLQRLAVEKASRAVQDADARIMGSRAQDFTAAFYDARDANAIIRDADNSLTEVRRQIQVVVPANAAPGGNTARPPATSQPPRGNSNTVNPPRGR
ncbi:MAG: hypothetical protein KF690_08505 [Bacteroidetes bacterium]|nr:hypothetical protein [Bacteroidota bacterium]